MCIYQHWENTFDFERPHFLNSVCKKLLYCYVLLNYVVFDIVS